MTEQELLTASGGELVGGKVIAIVNGKHTALGQRGPGGVFNLTAEGVIFAAEYKPAPAAAPKASKKKDEGKNLDLSLDELVETADKLG